MRTRSLLAAAVAAAFAGTLLAVPPAAAAPATTVVGARDYATEVLGDAWDYADAGDVQLAGVTTAGLTGAVVRDGRLSFGTGKQGHLHLLWGGYPGGLYLGKDGSAAHNRIDAGRYTRMSLQLWSSRDTAAAIFWSSCEGLDIRCEGGMPLSLKAGWHTYDVALANHGPYGRPQAWSGTMTGLRLFVSPGSAAQYALDWARLYTPSAGARVASSGALTWDADSDPSDNSGDDPGWGALRCTDGGCDLSALPPGTYWLRPSGSRDAGTQVLVRRPARPVIVDPDVVGGPEYSAGDPWDFDRPSDVALVGNTTVTGWGPRMTAVNGGPHPNDPYVFMHLRGGLIDPSRYHRLTVRSGYEGGFSLEDTAGGGTHGRVIWYHADQAGLVPVETKEWVTYPGTETHTVDLSAPGIHEEDIPAERKRAWTSAPVKGLRWDPNEDRGARRWSLDRVALRADDEAGTSFAIRWYDDGFAPGSTVSLYRDTDRAGFDGVPILTGHRQTPGVNTVTWDVRSVPEGTWWLYAVVDGPAGTGRSYATGPLRVDRRVAGQGASPATPVARDLASACPQGRVPEDGLADVPGGTVHEAAVDCVVWWGVAHGTSAGRYAPDVAVNRGQMALFVSRLLAAAGVALPSDPPNAFLDDEAASPGQQLAIDQLAALEVVGGVAPGRYAPGQTVSREQMATFLVRAYEKAGGTLPATPADHFRDDAGSAHAARIDQAAGLGIATGVGDERYGSSGTVSRLQMGSFLARLLDVLVAAGPAEAPAR